MKEQAQSAMQSSELEMVIPEVCQFLELMMAPTYVKRLIGFILLSIGMTPKQIAGLLSVTDRTCRNWRRDLRRVMQPEDIGKLLVRPLVRIGTKAWDVASAIFTEIDSNNFHSLRQIADMVLDRFHIRLSLPTVGRMMHRAGYKKLKAGSLPAKADPAARRTFYNDTLCPLLEIAKAGMAAGFLHGCVAFRAGV